MDSPLARRRHALPVGNKPRRRLSGKHHPGRLLGCPAMRRLRGLSQLRGQARSYQTGRMLGPCAAALPRRPRAHAPAQRLDPAANRPPLRHRKEPARTPGRAGFEGSRARRAKPPDPESDQAHLGKNLPQRPPPSEKLLRPSHGLRARELERTHPLRHQRTDRDRQQPCGKCHSAHGHRQEKLVVHRRRRQGPTQRHHLLTHRMLPPPRHRPPSLPARCPDPPASSHQQNDPRVHPGQMGRGPQRKTSQSRVAGGAGDVVAFTYDIYTTPSKNNGVLGATLTVHSQPPPCSLCPLWLNKILWVNMINFFS